MLRNIKTLTQQGDRYYLDGKPFTGVTFKISDKQLEDLHEFKNGKFVGTYQNQYFSKHFKYNSEDLIHVDLEDEDLDLPGGFIDSETTYKGQYFSGVAYELSRNDEVAMVEFLFNEGDPIAYVVWNDRGDLAGLKLGKGDIDEYYNWHEDRTLAYYCIRSHQYSTYLIEISIELNNELKSLWLEEQYFEWIETHKEELEFLYLESLDSFKELIAAPRLSLNQSGVDDRVFNAIACNNGLRKLSNIILAYTSLSESTILSLADLQNLKEIHFCDPDRNLENLVKQLKHKRPDLLIFDEYKGAKPL
ncbi:hypothetical protein [Baaleninema simplex]|uniref:hypothetical protein n=1 Tax=Baaleninema simplex TaxID=2862350 RepID=UPI00034B1778|nr:hypothetical protein [Baaleninema simplex]